LLALLVPLTKLFNAECHTAEGVSEK